MAGPAKLQVPHTAPTRSFSSKTAPGEPGFSQGRRLGARAQGPPQEVGLLVPEGRGTDTHRFDLVLAKKNGPL